MTDEQQEHIHDYEDRFELERDYEEEDANRALLRGDDEDQADAADERPACTCPGITDLPDCPRHGTAANRAELEHKGRVLVERMAERMAERDPEGEAAWQRQRDELIQRIEGWQVAGETCMHGRPLQLAFCCARPQLPRPAFDPPPETVLLISSADLCPQLPPSASRNPLVQVAEVVAWLHVQWKSNPDFDRQYVLEQIDARLTALVEGEL